MSYLKFLVVLFAVALGPVGLAKTKVDPILSKFKTPTPKRSVAYQLPQADKEALENPAVGLIIAFKTWPLSEKNKKAMLKKAQAHGLKEKANYSRFKIYVFGWKKGRKISEAQKACESFLDFPHLDYCEPDLLQIPGDNHKPIPPEPLPIYLKPPPEVFPDDQTGDVKTCNIVSSQLGLSTLDKNALPHKISDYWAQEMIGSDLVREDLKLYPPVAKKTFVAVFDDPDPAYDEHHIRSKNIISDDGHHAILPDIGGKIPMYDGNRTSLALSHINNFLNQAEARCASSPLTTPTSQEFSTKIIAYDDPDKQCQATHLPSFINRSLHQPYTEEDNETFYRTFKAISPPSILINSAGNHFSTPIPESLTKASRDFNAIVVGSLSAFGEKSNFSQQGEAVHIMAPSGYNLTTADERGAYKSYGGTSGAAPIVTGSLAGFEWAAGYHPTAEEAKILLEKTAIATPYSNDDPRTNGVGMVNAYKLMMVGKHLKKTCGRNITCFKNMIRQDDTYLFHNKDPSLNKDLVRAFPNCTPSSKVDDLQKPPASCADKAKVFKKLRKEAFLNPQDKDLWARIACIYGQGGFTANKEFALRIYDSLSGRRTSSDFVCKEDSDCVLVPHCSIKNRLLAYNKQGAKNHYLTCVEQYKKTPLCNGKSRCGPTERITIPLPPIGYSPITSHDEPGGNERGIIIDYSTACEELLCKLNKTETYPPITSHDEPGGVVNPIESSPSGSGSVK